MSTEKRVIEHIFGRTIEVGTIAPERMLQVRADVARHHHFLRIVRERETADEIHLYVEIIVVRAFLSPRFWAVLVGECWRRLMNWTVGQ